MHSDVEETWKRHYTDQMPDVEYEDVEDLPVEDVRVMTRRRHEEQLQAYREASAAASAIEKGLDELPEEKRERAKEGLKRFLVTENTAHLSDEN